MIEDNLSDSIVDFIIKQSIRGTNEVVQDELNIPREEMEAFLRLVGQMEATMSDEAELLLRKYFLATRAARPS